jgi:hypothetical protein
MLSTVSIWSAVAHRIGTTLRRLIALAVMVTAGYFAFELYVFGGDPLISAFLVLVAIVAAGVGLL